MWSYLRLLGGWNGVIERRLLSWQTNTSNERWGSFDIVCESACRRPAAIYSNSADCFRMGILFLFPQIALCPAASHFRSQQGQWFDVPAFRIRRFSRGTVAGADRTWVKAMSRPNRRDCSSSISRACERYSDGRLVAGFSMCSRVDLDDTCHAVCRFESIACC